MRRSSEQVSLLYRGSSEPDGVRSRGTGWHPREVFGKNGTQRLETLARDLVEGDLARSVGKTASLYVWTGGALQKVARPDVRRQYHRSDASQRLATEAGGDWSVFWEKAQDAADLLHHGWVSDLSDDLLTLAGCDCAEVAVRYVLNGDARSQRGLRTARRWAVGSATVDEVASAKHAAHEAYLATDRATNWDLRWALYSVYSAIAHPDANAADFADAADFAASALSYAASGDMEKSPEFSRSLIFLVRARIPAWRVGLARVGLVET